MHYPKYDFEENTIKPYLEEELEDLNNSAVYEEQSEDSFFSEFVEEILPH